MKSIILVILFFIIIISCDNVKMVEYYEDDVELCIDNCINDLIRKMDESNFSQNQFNNFKDIISFCEKKAIKYKCYEGYWEYQLNKKRILLINKKKEF